MRTLLQIVLASVVLIAAAPAEKGALRLQSQPGVEVEWEGVVLGETDGRGILLIRDIPPGEYGLTLRKAGYRAEKTRISVTPGETTFALRLEPLPPPPAAKKPSQPARAAPPAPTRRPAPPLPAESPAEESKPPAEAEPEPPQPGPESPTTAAEADPDTGGRGPGRAAWALPAARAVVLLAVMTLALLLAIALRSRLKTRQPDRVRSRRSDRGKRPSKGKKPPAQPDSKQSSWFLEELRQREASTAADQAAKTRRGEKEVIEVTDFEIMEEDT